MRWPWRRRAKVTVVVDPVQLTVLHHLLRFGAATQDELYEEVRGTLGTEREMFTTAMADLAAQDIVDYRYDADGGATRLVLTELGLRLKGKLPAESRSRLSIYV